MKIRSNENTTRLACYSAYFTMSSVFCVPPLLFVTFHEQYGVSYTLLGTLVLTNFCTQLGIDLILTFFSKYFNVRMVIRVMPLITSLGLFLYALIPSLFPKAAYAGLLIGTVLFSVSSGLSEVLLSPTIAALPSDNPQGDMSLFHSLYAFGVLCMVLITTLFFSVFTESNWMYLLFFLAFLPVAASLLFWISPIPDMAKEASVTRAEKTRRRAIGLALCTACIFFGSCSENAMSNWISGFMENALGIEKSIGDILGLAIFAVLLGAARISYAKYGKNICRVLLLGMMGASVCYLVAGLSPSVTAAFFACILTGLCTAMLWPGTLILMEENIPHAGVEAFALLAAGGDLGASIAPQLMGVVVDVVSESSAAAEIGMALSMTTEQIGLKAGMIVCAMFPILGTVLMLFIMRYFKKTET